MLLLDLPTDLVRRILECLAVRSLLNAASTCRTLRDLAGALPLSPSMTSRTRMHAWLALPHVAPRVNALAARYCLWGRCSFLGALLNLRALTVSFGHVSAAIFRHLPHQLEHLELHRVEGDYGDVFTTTRLLKLTRLHTLKLTFTHHWDVVMLTGLDALPLRLLSVRLAPMLVVRSPLRIAKVRLQAVSSFVCPYEIHCEDLSLECTEGIIAYDVILTEASARNLRFLSLSSPRRKTVPALEWMEKLEELHLKYDSALLPLCRFERLSALRRLVVNTRFGVSVASMHSRLPRTVEVQVTVEGVPLSAHTIQALFFGADPITT